MESLKKFLISILMLSFFLIGGEAMAYPTQDICSSAAVPNGWVVTGAKNNPSTCNTPYPPLPGQANVYTITNISNLPLNTAVNICTAQSPVPGGWASVGTTGGAECGCPYGAGSCSANWYLTNIAIIQHTSCLAPPNPGSCPSVPPPSGSISASPSSVVVPYGQSGGSTKISYTTANTTVSAGQICIWAGNNGATPSKWACNGTSASNLVWPYVPAGGSTKFILAMSDSAPSPVLSTVTVTGTAGAPTTFTFKPAYNLVSTGPTSANVLIPATASPTTGPFGFQWNAPGYDALDLQGQVNNGPWQSPVWIAPSGVNGDNIPLGTTYNYRLYPHGATTPLLASLSVTGIAAPAPTFSINPAHVIVPLNATTGSFTFTWNAPGYETLDLVGQVVTNGVAGPWGSPVWIAASGNNGDNIPVGTTYNYRFYPHGDSVHIIGTLSVTASR